MPQTFTAYRAGGRSRTVQNIATDAVGVPQPEQIAYTITEATSAPTADTDGYKNIGLQKNITLLNEKQRNRWQCYYSIVGISRRF